MNVLEFTWYYIVPFLFVLTVLVYVHEWGHYWVARQNNVRVEVFSIGFGPEIFGWNNAAGMRWKIGAIPFGGYIKMFGESETFGEGEEQRPLTPEERAVSFHFKSLGQRAAVVAAGPIANFLLAIVLFAGLVMTYGVPHHYAAIGEILPKSAAADAGFKIGDRITSVDGETITWFTDLVRIVSVKPGVPLKFGVLRADQDLIVQATPKKFQRTGEDGSTVDVGLLGVRYDPKQAAYERQNPMLAVWIGAQQTALLTGNILSYIGQIIVGNQKADDLGGPIRIAKMSGQMAQGGLENLIFFMAALSVNLGLINLFPIPLLDGGHLLFYGAEALRGRPLGPRAQEYGFRIGLALVLSLMVFATWNDLGHFGLF